MTPLTADNTHQHAAIIAKMKAAYDRDIEELDALMVRLARMIQEARRETKDD